ncbi:DNA excision repair protein ERCC-1 [Dichanthelium oligosanthes]|uniref:DNA excision repair protein ERCC-1 n=1 Tax=Dichanthelium oligosanthes TaxID=888268 RepID=A0A1E5WHD5_9POAL|nr:DNA excision repair protein ERCC-1 [Dichanthelium oligosanthes]
MDREKEQQGPPERQPGKNLIKIPSYQEVFGPGASSSSTPPSYNPPLASAVAPAASSSASSSGSFSQAFSFLKSSEFYSPPPPPPQPASTPRYVYCPPLVLNPWRRRPQTLMSSVSWRRPPQASSSAPVPQSKNAILVSHRQRGNPLLKHIRNARWTFADVVPDYVLGQSSCALYLSIRYHLLHPDYLYYRIRELQKNFRFRVILCHVDVEDVVKPLHEITRTALLHDCTVLCGWSLEECGRYLETIKVYENKPADNIREHMDNDYLSRKLSLCSFGLISDCSAVLLTIRALKHGLFIYILWDVVLQLTHALTSVRHVNKTDVVTLGSSFGVKRLYDTFHEPFKRVSARPNLVVPDTPDREKASGQPSSTNDSSENTVEKPEASKNKKGSDVRSALTAAFAKYSEKICNQSRDAANEAGEGAGSSNMEDGKTKDDKQ